MLTNEVSHLPRRPRLHPLVRAIVLLTTAALIAVGCGSGNSSSNDTVADIAAQDGPLAWLPANTWVVARASLDPKQLDRALNTLGRLPIWDLAESQLPAKNGDGLRTAALKELSKHLPGSQSAGDLEDAFGNEIGWAVTSNDLTRFTDHTDHPSGDGTVPVAMWVEVDDQDAADSVLNSVFPKAKTHSRDGVDYSTGRADGDEIAWTMSGDLLIVTNGAKELERLIDVHEGDRSLADDDDARRALDGSLTDAPVSVAIGTDALLAALPGVMPARGSSDAADGSLGNDSSLPSRQTVADLVRAKSIDALIPDWIGMSATVDETGIRMRTTWSNPRDLAKPDVSSRELVERMPATAESVVGSASDGSMLGRFQAVWSDVSTSADIDIADLAKQCPPTLTKTCTAAVSVLTWVLEDDELATTLTNADDTTTAIVQSPSSTFASLYGSIAAASHAATAVPSAIPAATAAIGGMEIARTGGDPAIHPPVDVTRDVAAAGLTIMPSADRLSATVKVAPKSELGAALAAAVMRNPKLLSSFGVDAADLLSSRGVTMTGQRVDDVTTYILPLNAKSTIVPALRGTTDRLTDNDRYRAAVDAVDAPQQVGVYGWFDLRQVVDHILTTVSATSPVVKRIQPTVANNLDPIPGILGWTTRLQVEHEDLGVAELAIPITK